MTNSLIPHTFVPGTKAKAQEVNANFIALAEEIQNTQTTMTTRFTQVNTEITNTRNDIAANFSDIDMVNTKMLTNAILKAPNGIVTYNNQTVTVKSGLRVLVPSGYNSDGRYLTVDYTVSSDISKTLTAFTSTSTIMFLNVNGTTDVVSKGLVYFSDTTATTDGAYKYSGNKWYKYSATESSWQETTVIPVAEVTWDSDSLISKVKPYNVSKIITSSDLSNPDMVSAMLPEEIDFVIKTEKISGINYKHYKSGTIDIFALITPTSASVAPGNAVAHIMTLPSFVHSIQNVLATTTSRNFICVCEGVSSNVINLVIKNISNATTAVPSFFLRVVAHK